MKYKEQLEGHRFKVGDPVRVVKNTSYGYAVGTLGEVTKLSGIGYFIRAIGGKDCGLGSYHTASDLEPAFTSKKEKISQAFSVGNVIQVVKSGNETTDAWNKRSGYMGQIGKIMSIKPNALYGCEYEIRWIGWIDTYYRDGEYTKWYDEGDLQSFTGFDGISHKSYTDQAIITNSSPRRGTITRMLQKMTNFVRSLAQPLQNYIRLNWVEVRNDEYQITQEGRDAALMVLFGLTTEKSLSEYAESEVKRLEREDKKNK